MLIGFGCALALAACSGEAETIAKAEDTAPPRQNHVAMVHDRLPDPDAGRDLFVNKGCVLCHSVNSVGGTAASALDAPVGELAIDPLDFAARLWAGAPAMIELQSLELGYAIDLTADEIADLAAFSADRRAQKKLKEDALPADIKAGLLNEPFWTTEDWDDYLRGGREGENDSQ